MADYSTNIGVERTLTGEYRRHASTTTKRKHFTANYKLNIMALRLAILLKEE